MFYPNNVVLQKRASVVRHDVENSEGCSSSSRLFQIGRFYWKKLFSINLKTCKWPYVQNYCLEIGAFSGKQIAEQRFLLGFSWFKAEWTDICKTSHVKWGPSGRETIPADEEHHLSQTGTQSAQGGIIVFSRSWLMLLLANCDKGRFISPSKTKRKQFLILRVKNLHECGKRQLALSLALGWKATKCPISIIFFYNQICARNYIYSLSPTRISAETCWKWQFEQILRNCI